MELEGLGYMYASALRARARSLASYQEAASRCTTIHEEMLRKASELEAQYRQQLEREQSEEEEASDELIEAES